MLMYVDAVLLLTIPEPGSSGQKFDMDGLLHIDKLNLMPFRKISGFASTVESMKRLLNNFKLRIVSGSSVLNHKTPRAKYYACRLRGMMPTMN